MFLKKLIRLASNLAQFSSSDFEAVFAPEENGDWNFARNGKIALRRKNCELVQSIFSSTVENRACPNRDLASEGYSAIINGENWKLADAFLISAKTRDGQTLALRAKSVRALPWKATYAYEARSPSSPQASEKIGELSVEYYLHSESEHPLLEITISTSAPAQITRAAIIPLVDIRETNSPSDCASHKTAAEKNALRIQRNEAELLLKSPQLEKIELFPPWQRAQKWNYKMGTGEREWREGKLFFKSEERELCAPAELTLALEKGKATLLAYGGPAEKSGTEKANSAKTMPRELRTHDEKKERLAFLSLPRKFPALSRAEKKWGKEKAAALHARLHCLLCKFEFQHGGNHNPAPSLDAGSMWFRKTWHRDQFETINANFELFHTHNSKKLRQMITKALHTQKHGIIPNFVSNGTKSETDFHALDATLIAMISAFKYLEKADDKVLKFLATENAHALIQNLEKGINLEDGQGARLNENALVFTSANWSWMDSRVSIEIHGERVLAPTRIPKDWQSEIASHPAPQARELICGPHYALAEINALWITFLTMFSNHASHSSSYHLETLLSKARLSFKKTFFPQNAAPCHIAAIRAGELRQSSELSSASICALSTCAELFSNQELEQNFSSLEKIHLYSEGKLFGALCKLPASGEIAPFLGDAEYHGAVCWPRDSPHLISLLLRLGKKELAEQVLLNALEHQQNECAIFYNNELFAPPIPSEANPSPTQTSGRPVPLKNPAQLWSQWAQPFFDYLQE